MVVNPLSLKNALCNENGVLRIENFQKAKDKSIDITDEVIEAQTTGGTAATPLSGIGTQMSGPIGFGAHHGFSSS